MTALINMTFILIVIACISISITLYATLIAKELGENDES